MSLPTLVLPGQLLGPSSKYDSGPGTHQHHTSIYASIAGRPRVSPSFAGPLLTISVPRLLPSATSAPIPSPAVSNTNVLPFVGGVVLCRVTRLTPRQVDVRILQVGDQVCGDEWAGVVRREDVRATEKDKVLVVEGFRVGDVVRAVVISLGDQSNYYLTTAKNDLGVIMARSEAGNEMVPISWKDFRDPLTGLKESRKVAKPIWTKPLEE